MSSQPQEPVGNRGLGKNITAFVAKKAIEQAIKDEVRPASSAGKALLASDSCSIFAFAMFFFTNRPQGSGFRSDYLTDKIRRRIECAGVKTKPPGES